MQESEVSEGSNDHLDSDGSVIVYNNEPDRLKKKTKKDLKRKVSNFIRIISDDREIMKSVCVNKHSPKKTN